MDYRSFVLGVANQAWMQKLIEARGRGLVRRFVAGDELADAIRAVDVLENSGVHGILDLLGEMVTTHEQVQEFVKQILNIFPSIQEKTWPKYVSIKLSQLGLDQSLALAEQNAIKILEAAKTVGAFVRIDMEDSARVDKTITVFRALRAHHDNVGLVLQAMLRRTAQDLEDLQDLKPNLRIVKGAYLEPSNIAFANKLELEAQYLHLVYKNIAAGNHTAVATHDPRIIGEVKTFIAGSKIPASQIEFQFLYGVRRDLQMQLATEGHTVRAYIPYGKDWYAYFSRRIAERPDNALFVLRGMVKG